jgi:hypothetical protein
MRSKRQHDVTIEWEAHTIPIVALEEPLYPPSFRLYLCIQTCNSHNTLTFQTVSYRLPDRSRERGTLSLVAQVMPLKISQIAALLATEGGWYGEVF